MKDIRALFIRLVTSFSKEKRDRELSAEFESHLQMHVEDNIRAGMNPFQARRDALMKIGNLEAAKEAVRQRSTLVWFETSLQDLRYAWRGLRGNPGFAITTVLSLALGLGSSLAIFTLADNLLLRPLPYPHPSQLLMLWDENKSRDLTRGVISPGEYFDWKKQQSVFAELAAFKDGPVVLEGASGSEEVEEDEGTADLLPMLGVVPFRGRLFTAADQRPGAPSVLIISYPLWQRSFGGQQVIGHTVHLRGALYTIVGVTPPDFYFSNRKIDLWEPLVLDPVENYRKTQGRWLHCTARMKPGLTARQVQREMDAVARRQEAEYPEFSKNWTIMAEPLRDWLVTQVKTSVLVLLGAVSLLLAVACANAANLFMARYTVRRREMAVRISLGAGRWRIVRQLLTESLLVGLISGALGMLLANWAVRVLLFLAPKNLTQLEIAIDLRIYLFALALSVATGILFGLAPALVTARPRLTIALNEDGRASMGSGNRLRAWLAGAEVALSVILLSGATLLFRTLVSFEATQPGLNASNVLALRILLPVTHYSASSKRTQFFTRVAEQIQHLPGVGSASAVRFVPFDGLAAGTFVDIAGHPIPKPGEEPQAGVDTVLPGYFKTMGIPLISGRDFSAADDLESAPYRFIVNQAFVRKFLLGENPLRTQISVYMETGANNPFGQIIGVVGDVKDGALDKEPVPMVYYPHAHLAYSQMTMVVRAEHDPLTLAEPIRQVVRNIDPAQPIFEARTMEQILSATFSRQRFSAILLTGFSAASLTLAAIGIYGLLAYSVSERSREIGVRVAVGAEPAQITSLFLRAGARLALAGVVTGTLGALALSGLLKNMLFGVGPRDPLTLSSCHACSFPLPLLRRMYLRGEQRDLMPCVRCAPVNTP